MRSRTLWVTVSIVIAAALAGGYFWLVPEKRITNPVYKKAEFPRRQLPPPPEVWEATLALDVPSVVAGAAFKVHWTGPGRGSDFITVVAPDAEQHAYNSYSSPRTVTPITLIAPDQAGDYEVRYVAYKNGQRILARQAISVSAATANLTAPATAMAGAVINVHWQGPDNNGDFLAVVPANTEEPDYTNGVQVRRKQPVKLPLPSKPGGYELRYVTGQSERVLSQAPLQLTEAKASLTVPERVKAGHRFEVQWTGPGGSDDKLMLIRRDRTQHALQEVSLKIPTKPIKFRAQWRPGIYEVRYLFGRGRQVLARAEIEVAPRQRLKDYAAGDKRQRKFRRLDNGSQADEDDENERDNN